MSVLNPLTLKELQETLGLKFTKLNIQAEKEGESIFDEEPDDDNEKEETALVATGFKKPFKGRCNLCG